MPSWETRDPDVVIPILWWLDFHDSSSCSYVIYSLLMTFLEQRCFWLSFKEMHCHTSCKEGSKWAETVDSGKGPPGEPRRKGSAPPTPLCWKNTAWIFLSTESRQGRKDAGAGHHFMRQLPCFMSFVALLFFAYNSPVMLTLSPCYDRGILGQRNKNHS